ncbi:hypothetical protein X942_657 [Burkholderia pseudomallei MSHR5596]|nr:hypothetical protein X942_657 [Burkholderia pseudomallei MSHR5596]
MTRLRPPFGISAPAHDILSRDRRAAVATICEAKAGYHAGDFTFAFAAEPLFRKVAKFRKFRRGNHRRIVALEPVFLAVEFDRLLADQHAIGEDLIDMGGGGSPGIANRQSALR